jgi:hypothetical protein
MCQLATQRPNNSNITKKIKIKERKNLSEENIPVLITVNDQEIEEALAKLNQIKSGSMPQVSREVDSVQKQAANVIANEGVEIRGVEQAGKRVLRMLPGMREALSIQKSLGQLSAGNVMGALNMAFLAYNIVVQVKRLYDDMKRKQEEFEREVMSLRGYESREEFVVWQNEQKTGLNVSRNRIVAR